MFVVSLKTLSSGVGTTSTIDSFIVRTSILFVCVFSYSFLTFPTRHPISQLRSEKCPCRGSMLKPDPSRKMRNKIMCKELPEIPPDISPKVRSLQKRCLKMSPTLSPKSCVSGYHWAAEEFPATSSPQPITPRDEISRSGNPSLRQKNCTYIVQRATSASCSLLKPTRMSSSKGLQEGGASSRPAD